jgi:RNA polymerase sigma-70 factor (ECF subfamily)
LVQAPDLEQIYREHHTFVWRVVRGFSVAPDAVDDAVQEVFVVLHRRRNELDFTGPVRGLLYGVARRVAKRAREKTRARATLQLVPSADRRPDPEQRALTRERADVVRDALHAMDDDKRMTFLLADVEGMTIPQVAESMGVNVNTAYARQRAARKLVQAAIARHHAVQEGDRVRAGRR